MLLDILAKIKQYDICAFFLTGSASEFEWPYIIQVVARQYGEELSDKEIYTKDWDTKGCYLLRNSVAADCQIDLVFKNLWGKVTLSVMQ